ncbi:MAG: hypothetical protein M1822_008206 [Bathelium mastoideum]|nr:MAG: hypothetical protein M1822_008206 [Bathelium mastoideum]
MADASSTDVTSQSEHRPPCPDVTSANAEKNQVPSRPSESSPVEEQRVVEAPHTFFTLWEKRLIVFAASAAGFFSPISANIYFPALNSLRQDYHTTSTIINLTVTVYMIFQGLAPSITGSLSDNIGRRPVYALCFIIYLAANIGLALQRKLVALIILRCVQSSGSSGTVALANGVISDVASASERGVYIGYASLGGVLGVAVGPVIGGILSDFLGWRSIFWFLVIASGLAALVLLAFLPETGRSVVGNGSQRPPRWNLCLWDFFPSVIARRKQAGTVQTTGRPKKGFINPFLTLRICAEKEASIVLFANGLLFAGYYAVASAIPQQYGEIYGFNDLQIGLSFIPIGVSSAVSTVAVGRAVDWNFIRHSRRLGLSVEEAKAKNRELGNFPIERVRCEIALPILGLASISSIIYGWLLDYRTSVAGPLVMLFFVGFAANGFFTILSVLMVDVYPEAPATATAANNLVRCWLGAAFSVAIIPMIEAMSSGWAYTFLALLYLLIIPLILVIMRWGPTWRADRVKAAKATV